MLSFLSSLSLMQASALLGLLSLIIPLLIHWFNISRGRIIWVGSLALFEQVGKKRLSEIKISQYILLIIRLIIFTLLVLLLAQLVFTIERKESDDRLVLLTEDWLNNAPMPLLEKVVEAHQEDKVFLLNNSLLSKNAESQRLYPLSVNSLNNAKEHSNHPDSIDNIMALLAELESVEYLSKAQESLAKKPQRTIVYTTNRLAQFSYIPPSLESPIEWRSNNFAELDSPAEPIQVSLFYTADRIVDQQYLSLAFAYLTQDSDQQIAFQSQLISNDLIDSLSHSKRPDWLIYLANSAIPASFYNWMEQGTVVLVDHLQQPLLNHAAKDMKRLTSAGEVVEIYQSAILDAADSVSVTKNHLVVERPRTLWQDQFGEPLLVRHAPNYIQWLSRFHPDATNWLNRADFPRELATILINQSPINPQTMISHAEILDRYSRQQNNLRASPDVISRSLSHWLILVICFLWLTERYLAENNFTANRVPRND